MSQSPKVKQGTLHSNKKFENKINNFDKPSISLYQKFQNLKIRTKTMKNK